jgi:hypothetical protein
MTCSSEEIMDQSGIGFNDTSQKGYFNLEVDIRFVIDEILIKANRDVSVGNPTLF